MGSSLSIHNDARGDWEGEWWVKVAPGEERPLLAGYAEAAVGAIASAHTAAGATALLWASPAVDDSTCILGASTDSLAAVTAACAGISGAQYAPTAAGLVAGLTDAVAKQLASDGYTLFKPGEAKPWGNVPRSWRQRGAVLAIRLRRQAGKVLADKLVAHPLFCDATGDCSCPQERSLQQWIDKCGIETSTLSVPVQAELADPTRCSEHWAAKVNGRRGHHLAGACSRRRPLPAPTHGQPEGSLA